MKPAGTLSVILFCFCTHAQKKEAFYDYQGKFVIRPKQGFIQFSKKLIAVGFERIFLSAAEKHGLQQWKHGGSRC